MLAAQSTAMSLCPCHYGSAAKKRNGKHNSHKSVLKLCLSIINFEKLMVPFCKMYNNLHLNYLVGNYIRTS